MIRTYGPNQSCYLLADGALAPGTKVAHMLALACHGIVVGVVDDHVVVMWSSDPGTLDKELERRRRLMP